MTIDEKKICFEIWLMQYDIDKDAALQLLKDSMDGDLNEKILKDFLLLRSLYKNGAVSKQTYDTFFDEIFNNIEPKYCNAIKDLEDKQ